MPYRTVRGIKFKIQKARSRAISIPSETSSCGTSEGERHSCISSRYTCSYTRTPSLLIVVAGSPEVALQPLGTAAPAAQARSPAQLATPAARATMDLRDLAAAGQDAAALWTAFATLTVRAFGPDVIDELRAFADDNRHIDVRAHVPLLAGIVARHVELALRECRTCHGACRCGAADLGSSVVSSTAESDAGRVKTDAPPERGRRREGREERTRVEKQAPRHSFSHAATPSDGIPRRKSYRDLGYLAVRSSKLRPVAGSRDPDAPSAFYGKRRPMSVYYPRKPQESLDAGASRIPRSSSVAAIPPRSRPGLDGRPVVGAETLGNSSPARASSATATTTACTTAPATDENSQSSERSQSRPLVLSKGVDSPLLRMREERQEKRQRALRRRQACLAQPLGQTQQSS